MRRSDRSWRLGSMTTALTSVRLVLGNLRGLAPLALLTASLACGDGDGDGGGGDGGNDGATSNADGGTPAPPQTLEEIVRTHLQMHHRVPRLVLNLPMQCFYKTFTLEPLMQQTFRPVNVR